MAKKKMDFQQSMTRLEEIVSRWSGATPRWSRP